MDPNFKHGAGEDLGSPPAKLARTTVEIDDATLLHENLCRTQARYEHSLLVFSNERLAQSNIHQIHPLVCGVRILGDNFVLIFDSDANCSKAYKDLAAQKDLRVEYYKSNINQRSNDSKVNKMILMAQGIPETVTDHRMRELFPNALKTFLSRPGGKTPYAVINFFDEQDAYKTFKQCEGFVVDGFSVDVHYAFMPKDDQLNKKEVFVYGLPGNVDLQKMKYIFDKATELVVKPNRKATDSAPFYVIAKFENDGDSAAIFDRVMELNVGDVRVVAQYAKLKTPHDSIVHPDHNFLYHYSDTISLSLSVPSKWIKESRNQRAISTGGITEQQRKKRQKKDRQMRERMQKLGNIQNDIEPAIISPQVCDVYDENDQCSDDDCVISSTSETLPNPYIIENLRDRMWKLMEGWRGGSAQKFIDYLLGGMCDIIRESEASESANIETEAPNCDNYWSRMRASLKTAATSDVWASLQQQEPGQSTDEHDVSVSENISAQPNCTTSKRRLTLLSGPPKSNDDEASMAFFVSPPQSAVRKKKPLLPNPAENISKPTNGSNKIESLLAGMVDENKNTSRFTKRVPLLSLRFDDDEGDENNEELEAPQPLILPPSGHGTQKRKLMSLFPSRTAPEDTGRTIGPKKRALLESLAMLSKADDEEFLSTSPETSAAAIGRGKPPYANYYNMAATTAYHNYYMQAMSAGQIAAPYLYDDYGSAARSVQPPPPPPPAMDSTSSSGFFNSSLPGYGSAATSGVATSTSSAANRNYANYYPYGDRWM